MDYEKLHKDTINRLQQMVSCGKITVEVARGICADFIPESEDERIRKVIYGWICTQPPQLFDNGFSKEEMLAWLEKQGEQKPVPKFKVGDTMRTLQEATDGYTDGMPVVVSIDKEYYHCTNELIAIKDQDDYEFPPINMKQKPADKVEPEFKVGNWYLCTKDFFGKGVTFDKNTAYYCAKEGCLQNEYGCHIAIVKDLYNNFKLWTIQDAKEGDVLAAHECLVLFKEIDGLNIKCYCTYHYLGLNPSFYVDTLQNKTAFYPATKEQRELLFKKMHDAGYEWDAEKLELRKVEQKIEEKPLISLTDFQKAFELKAKQYDINLPNRGYDIHAMCKELYSLLTKQKPAEWSEEDEYVRVNLIEYLEGKTRWSKIKERGIDWLKSLKDKVQPQPKQE